MVLICPFIMNIYHTLLFHVIFYLKIDNITGKSRFQGRATLVSVVAEYRNKCIFTKIQYKYMANMHTSAGWRHTVQFVVMHTVLCLKA